MRNAEITHSFKIDAIYTAFNFEWKQDFIFNGESHDFWEIVFIREGCVSVTEDEKIYSLKGGNIIIHAPQEFHRIRSDMNTKPSGFIMTFKASGSLPEKLKDGVFLLNDELRADYEKAASEVIDFFNSSTPMEFSGQYAAAILSAFLIKLSFSQSETRTLASPSATEYRALVKEMTERVCDNLTLPEFAKARNISVSYLKLLFKKYAGISPKEYYLRLRATRAISLLESGTPAFTVSRALNFSSANYFSVFLKRHTGRLPSDFLK